MEKQYLFNLLYSKPVSKVRQIYRPWENLMTSLSVSLYSTIHFMDSSISNSPSTAASITFLKPFKELNCFWNPFKLDLHHANQSLFFENFHFRYHLSSPVFCMSPDFTQDHSNEHKVPYILSYAILPNNVIIAIPDPIPSSSCLRSP